MADINQNSFAGFESLLENGDNDEALEQLFVFEAEPEAQATITEPLTQPAKFTNEWSPIQESSNREDSNLSQL